MSPQSTTNRSTTCRLVPSASEIRISAATRFPDTSRSPTSAGAGLVEDVGHARVSRANPLETEPYRGLGAARLHRRLPISRDQRHRALQKEVMRRRGRARRSDPPAEMRRRPFGSPPGAVMASPGRTRSVDRAILPTTWCGGIGINARGTESRRGADSGSRAARPGSGRTPSARPRGSRCD